VILSVTLVTLESEAFFVIVTTRLRRFRIVATAEFCASPWLVLLYAGEVKLPSVLPTFS
jgi:hypothetical protein